MASLSRVAASVLVAVASLRLIYVLLPAAFIPIWSVTVLALAALEWACRRTARSPRAARFLEVGAAAIPVGLMVGLYWRVTQAWWLGDDPAILWAVVHNGVAGHFWSPTVWREFSSANFTPWVVLSYGLDWHFFELDPTGYYWHHLMSLAVVLVVAFGVLRRFLKPTTASLSLCLFVASGPVAAASQQLMTRHYVEGLGLALATAGPFAGAVERRSNTLAWLSSAAYLAACSAKEVFVPLVLVLPFLPVGDARARIRSLRPHLLALALYLLWRAWMLGPSHLLAGYGTLFTSSDGMSLRNVAARVAGVAGWSRTGALSVALILVALLVVLAVRRAAQALLLFGSAAAASVGPLLPVLGLLDPRMLLVASFVLSVALGAAMGLLGGSRSRSAAAIAVSMALLGIGVAAASKSPPRLDRPALERYRVEGTAILNGPPDLPLLHPVGPPWFYTCLGRLRSQLRGSASPTVCYDVCACSAAGRYRRGLEFASGGLHEASLDPAGCGFRAVPLTIDFSYETRTDTVRWDLGPYRDGQWYYIDDLGFAQPVPRHGFYPIRLTTAIVFTVRYVSREGWSAQSPRLQLDRSSAGPDGVVRLSWPGGGEQPGADPAPGT